MAGNALILSDKFELEPDEKVVSRFKLMGDIKGSHDAAEGHQWGQIVGRVAFGGVPTSVDDAFKKIEALEIEVRNALGKASERPGGKRSLGTGKTLDPNFKSYKSTLKGAFEHSVQILDAVGMPRSRNDISDDIAAAKPVKDAEDKLMGAVDTLFKIYESCDKADPRTVDAMNVLINRLQSEGLVNAG
jgi:hypothetical protein